MKLKFLYRKARNLDIKNEEDSGLSPGPMSYGLRQFGLVLGFIPILQKTGCKQLKTS